MIGPRSSNRRGAWLAAILLFAALGAIYGQVWNHEFVNIDDGKYIVDNPHVRVGLTWSGVKWAFTSFHASNWHPLTWLSHMVDCQLFGLRAGAHHLVSVLLHAVNACLLFFALRRMSGAAGASLFVAALFALHPLRVESVAWAAERKDLLAGLCFMLALHAYARYARSPGARRYAGVVLAMAIGLLAKPMLVTLPVVLLLLDVWPLGRLDVGGAPRDRGLPIGRLVLEKLPLAGLAAASGAVTLAAQSAGGAVSSLDRLPFLPRLANALRAYVQYAWETVWPAGLAVHYPHMGDSFSPLVLVGTLLLLTSITFLVFRQRLRRPYLLVGWLWYLVMLLPVIGLVQVGNQALADRYTYLPSIGLTLAVVWRLREWPGWSSPPARALAALVLLVYAALSWAQVGQWRTSLSLFEHALRVTSHNRTAHLNLGVALADAGRPQEAERQYRAAIELDPSHPEPFYNLGNLHRSRGDPRAAEEAYRRSLTLDPGFAPARLNLGLILLEQGDLDGALEAFVRADELRADYLEAKTNRANALRLLGRSIEALPHYREVLRVDPTSFAARLGLAGALLETGSDREGTRMLRELIADRPDRPQPHLALGIQLEREGRREEAAAHYRETLRLDPENASARRRLGLKRSDETDR